MAILDKIYESRVDVRSVAENRKDVIVRPDMKVSDLIWGNRDLIWFSVKQYGLEIYSDSILKWRSKKLFIDLQNIPAIAEMSSVYIVSSNYESDMNVAVGIKPDVRSVYGTIHFILSVYTMFCNCFDVKNNVGINIRWADDRSDNSISGGTFSYHTIIRFVEDFNRRRAWRDNLIKIVSRVFGRPVSILENFEAMNRIADWYMKTRNGRRSVFNKEDDRVTNE